MSSEADNSASKKQLEYIKCLLGQQGINQGSLPTNLSRYEASQIIANLISKRQNADTPQNQAHRKRRINEARLGMAIKGVLRYWENVGRIPWYDKKEDFIEQVLEVYALFTEINMRLRGEITKQ
ncbi:hypothetical protein [Desulfovulcanus sp.]